MKKISRRSFLTVCGAATAAAALTACGGSKSDSSTGNSAAGSTAGTTTLSFWTLALSPTYTDFIQGMIDQYERDHPDIKID